MNFKNPEGQTARWIEILGIYDLEVEHCQGRIHGNADGLSRRPCSNCSHCERGERKGQCADQLNAEELVGHEDGEDNDEYRCATATKKEEGSGMNLWLPKLSNAEMREAQLQDKCLGAIIKLKEENAERPSWEMISMESPTFKSYLDCSQSPIFPCDRRCSCGSHNASETGESAKCPWVGVVEGTASGKNRETVTASLCLVFNGRSRHLASPLIKSINSLFREEKACQIS